VNVRTLRAKTQKSYALSLMDVFLQDELSRSLLVKSRSSPKPPLDKQVETIFKMIEEKFGHTRQYKKIWNPKLFIHAANQKCRDSNTDSNKLSKDEPVKQAELHEDTELSKAYAGRTLTRFNLYKYCFT